MKKILGGCEYTLGALYLFTDLNDGKQEIGTLEDVDCDPEDQYNFRSRCGNKSEWFHKCEELKEGVKIGIKKSI